MSLKLHQMILYVAPRAQIFKDTGAIKVLQLLLF